MKTKITGKLELIGHRTKTRLLRSAGAWAIVGFAVIAFGLYSPAAVNADQSVGYINNKPVIVTTTPGSAVGYVNGQPFTHQGVVGTKQDGQKIMLPNSQQPYYDSTPTQDAQPQNTNTKKPKSKIDELNAAIKQNPNNASLYIQKADEQIKNKATPQQIINTLETALKQKKLEGTDREKATIYNGLAGGYNEKGDKRKAYQFLLKVKEADAQFPSIDYCINDFKEYFKRRDNEKEK